MPSYSRFGVSAPTQSRETELREDLTREIKRQYRAEKELGREKKQTQVDRDIENAAKNVAKE